MIEIELNESLRRRREELRGKIESLGEAEVGDASAAESLEARNRELKALNNSIEALNKKIHGKLLFAPQSHLYSLSFRGGEGSREVDR